MGVGSRLGFAQRLFFRPMHDLWSAGLTKASCAGQSLMCLGRLALSASDAKSAIDPSRSAPRIDGHAIRCGYMAQCKTSASGRAAECFANPYFAGAGRKAPARARRR